MLKIKVSHVNNLTDARYFAAMGVDFMGFCCNPGTERYCSIDKMREIISWVQGPDFVLEFDGWQSEGQIKEIIAENLGQALHLGAFSTYECDFELPMFKDFILGNHVESNQSVNYPVLKSDKAFEKLTKAEKETIHSLAQVKPVFLDLPFETHEIDDMIQTLNIYGLVLRGGHEERLGVKSFEALDLIFEQLQR